MANEADALAKLGIRPERVAEIAKLVDAEQDGGEQGDGEDRCSTALAGRGRPPKQARDGLGSSRSATPARSTPRSTR